MLSRVAATIAALVLLSPPAASQGRQEQRETSVGLVLPGGTELDSGSYAVEIDLADGRKLIGEIRVPSSGPLPTGDTTPVGETASSEAVPPPDGVESSDPPSASSSANRGTSNDSVQDPAVANKARDAWLWHAIVAVVTVLFAAGVGLLAVRHYYRSVLPQRETEPYWQALELIRESSYARALPQLTSVESRLPPELRQEARFFIALCHFHCRNEAEAERILADLHREHPKDEHVAYFLGYVRVLHAHHDEAQPILESLEKRRIQVGDSPRLLAIVRFCRALAAFEAGDVDRAVDLFARVEQYPGFAEHVPADLRNRHVVLGTRALFAKDLAVAADQFRRLEEFAGNLQSEEAADLMSKAKVGRALCVWLDKEPAHQRGLEELLEGASLALHPDGPLELPWPEPEDGSAKGDPEALRRALEEADKNFGLPPDKRVARNALRDMHFLRAMAVLRAWAAMDAKEAHDAIEEKMTAVRSRLACARALDERFSDGYLVLGLLMFYLLPPGPERTAAVDILEDAQRLGMRDPDALQIVNDRERIEQQNADAVDRYQQVLDRYLNDETVRRELKQALLERLSNLRTLMNRYRPPDLTRARTVPPTVQELLTRSEALRARIGELQKTAENPELAALQNELQRQSKQLGQQARAVEETESDLLAKTGDELFADR